jgi:hypothetical protein
VSDDFCSFAVGVVVPVVAPPPEDPVLPPVPPVLPPPVPPVAFAVSGHPMYQSHGGAGTTMGSIGWIDVFGLLGACTEVGDSSAHAAQMTSKARVVRLRTQVMLEATGSRTGKCRLWHHMAYSVYAP